MAEKAITALLLIIAIIHLVPITGFAGAAKLEALYGVPVADNTLEILMRHRAILFAILGGFFVYSAFTPAVQPVAFLAAAASILSFFYLAFSVGDYNPALNKIVIGDVVAALSLVAAVTIYFTRNGGNS